MTERAFRVVAVFVSVAWLSVLWACLWVLFR
jgi:hypothetical protein